MKQSKILFPFTALIILFAVAVGCTHSSIPESSPESFYPPRSPRTSVTGILAKPELTWSTISVVNNEDETFLLNDEDANKVYHILSTMEAEEVPTPYHYEGQFSSPVFTITIEYNDDTYERISTTETGKYFYRLTDTKGNNGDSGYIGGVSQDLYDILSSQE